MAKMTKKELEARVKVLEAENKRLRDEMGYDEYTDMNYEEYMDRKVNMMVAERLAEEDRRNNERAAEDPDFAYELRQIRYLESRYDDEYGCW